MNNYFVIIFSIIILFFISHETELIDKIHSHTLIILFLIIYLIYNDISLIFILLIFVYLIMIQPKCYNTLVNNLPKNITKFLPEPSSIPLDINIDMNNNDQDLHNEIQNFHMNNNINQQIDNINKDNNDEGYNFLNDLDDINIVESGDNQTGTPINNIDKNEDIQNMNINPDNEPLVEMENTDVDSALDDMLKKLNIIDKDPTPEELDEINKQNQISDQQLQELVDNI